MLVVVNAVLSEELEGAFEIGGVLRYFVVEVWNRGLMVIF